jgi:hypothetical protein
LIGCICICDPEVSSGLNCAYCLAGYTGTYPDCSANNCVATSTSTDDGSDANFYCINGGRVRGTTGSCICTSCEQGAFGTNCANDDHEVSDIQELFNKVSSYKGSTSWIGNTGSSIMSQGDRVMLAAKPYKCSDPGYCATTDRMLYISNLFGTIECILKSADCILDGESSRRMIRVQETEEVRSDEG